MLTCCSRCEEGRTCLETPVGARFSENLERFRDCKTNDNGMGGSTLQPVFKCITLNVDDTETLAAKQASLSRFQVLSHFVWTHWEST